MQAISCFLEPNTEAYNGQQQQREKASTRIHCLNAEPSVEGQRVIAEGGASLSPVGLQFVVIEAAPKAGLFIGCCVREKPVESPPSDDKNMVASAQQVAIVAHQSANCFEVSAGPHK